MNAKDKPLLDVDLKGAEQHFPLKNEPGRKGDQSHAESGKEMSPDIAKEVRTSDADTQIADALRDIANDS